MGISSTLFDQITALIVARRYDEAIAQAKASIERGGGPYAYALLARAYLEAGRDDDLRRILPVAVQKGPSIDWLRRFQAYDLLKQKRYPEALSAAHAALRLHPGHVWNYTTEAEILRAMGRYSEAVLAAQDALALDADNAEAHAELGRTYLEVGRLPEAEKQLRLAIDKSQRRAGLLRDLALAFEATGRPGDAAFVRRLADRREGKDNTPAHNAPVWANLLVIGMLPLLLAILTRGRGSMLAAAGFYVVGAAVCVFCLRLASRDPLLGHKPDAQMLAWSRQS